MKGYRSTGWTIIYLLEMAKDTLPFFMVLTVFCLFFAIIFFSLTKQAEMEFDDERYEGKIVCFLACFSQRCTPVYK